jgi:Fuc2NAc and GlcNAc transferase
MQWISCVLVLILSVVFTKSICKIAWNFGFVDEPGYRRSHLEVTPRGGGLAIVITFWLWIIGASLLAKFPSDIWLPLLPSLGVAFVGFWDDIKSLSALKRLLIQFICAAASLKLMGGIKVDFAVMGYYIPREIMYVIALFFIVWSVNLYNFMDGVNGLAGFEALTISIFMGILAFIESYYQWSSMWMVLACAVAGFLYWNFPKAKIFLGDVGSYFLGFVFSIILIESANIKPRWFWCGMILLGYFVVDATITLLVRIWFKQPIFQAHHTHAFQIFLKNFSSSHTKVTGFVVAINLFWLMPWALIVSKGYMNGFLAMLIAYLPLAIIVWNVKAGRPTN